MHTDFGNDEHAPNYEDAEGRRDTSHCDAEADACQKGASIRAANASTYMRVGIIFVRKDPACVKNEWLQREKEIESCICICEGTVHLQDIQVYDKVGYSR